MAQFRAHFEAVIAVRRTASGDDLITALIKAEEEAQMLTGGEILSLAVLLLFAGNETMTNLLGNTMSALLSHPDQLGAVQADHSLIPNVVEETLRYDAPVVGLLRQATEDVELSASLLCGLRLALILPPPIVARLYQSPRRQSG